MHIKIIGVMNAKKFGYSFIFIFVVMTKVWNIRIQEYSTEKTKKCDHLYMYKNENLW